MAVHLYTYDDPPSERDLERTLRVLQDDGVIAYPTDLNWAFGCDPTSAKALDRMHRLKPAHAKSQPFSLLVSSIAMAADYVNIDSSSYRLLRKAWPGPYTVLLGATRTFPRLLKDKRRVVGVRIPASPLVQAVVERLGKPLATTSVPRLGAPGSAGHEQDDPEDDDGTSDLPHFGYEVFEAFGHAIDLVLDLGGELPGAESTIVDLTEPTPVIIRRGAGDPALFELET